MAEDITPVGTSASITDPQPPQGTPSPASPEPGGDEQVNNPAARKYAEEAATERKARKALEAKLAEYQKRDQEAENAKLGDLEKAQKQAAELAKQVEVYRKAAAVSELKVAAKDAGAISVNAVVAILAGQIEYGDDGAPTNVAELLKGLTQDEPQLFKSATPEPAKPPVSSGGATSPGRAASAAATANQPSADYFSLGSRELWKR
jgi:hypothetical protein